jgi:hypothetical protein
MQGSACTGLQRVERGAPLRLNPMDRPFGNLDGVWPGDEVTRVRALLNSLHVENGVDRLIERLVSDAPAPWLQEERMADIGTTSGPTR